MIYNFTQKQYEKIWQEVYDSRYSISNWAYTRREIEFNRRFGNKLTYSEGLDEDFWGCIVGNEKDVNWFLLHL